MKISIQKLLPLACKRGIKLNQVKSNNELLELAIDASLKAGAAILEVYGSDFAIEHKEDKSPLTLADSKSHTVISSVLKKSGLPVLSEEGRNIAYEERKKWEFFWLADPLDGTKEFIKRNGEFTVNIALIEKNKPVMGVIYVPVLKELYYAAEGMGAFKVEKVSIHHLPVSLEQLHLKAQKLPIWTGREQFTVVASRSHLSEETEVYINELKKQHGEIALISAGSSLKFCLVAEGKADIYPRFGPTMEWDTAAGQAIVEQAGSKVINAVTQGDFLYNKQELLNPFFIIQ